MSLRQKVGAWSQTLLSIVATRVELFALELNQEKNEFLKILVWLGGALFFGALAVIILTLLIILLFWSTEWRYWAFAVVLLVYGGASLFFVFKLLRRLNYGPVPFAASLEELQKDLQLIQQLRNNDDHSGDSR